jgi:glycosyltransferase involved in cell wall biosynthesis
MNIIMISRFYHPAIGGVETQVKEIAERLVKDNNKVTIYTFDHTIKYTADEEINGVQIKRFGCKRISYGIEIPSAEFIHALKNSDADIIHLHSLHTLLPYYTYKAITGSGSKFVITTHYHGRGHTFIRNILFRLYRLQLSNAIAAADKLICVSRYESDLLLRDFSINQDRVIVIPNGINRMKISKLNGDLEKNPSKILFVGRLEKYKNVDRLVKALGFLDRHILVIVGEGPEKEKIFKLIRHLNISDRVRLVSNLSEENLTKEYQTSGIFVMPSHWEAYGIAVAEALSMGLQTIVANSSALKEFVTDGHAYGVSLPISVEKIVKAIVDVSHKPIPSKFVPYTWDMVVRELISVYQSLARHTD